MMRFIWKKLVNYKLNKTNFLGPRMVMEIISILDNSFHGAVLYTNPNYKDPNSLERQKKASKAQEAIQKQDQKEAGKIKEKIIRDTKIPDVVGEVFDTEVVEKNLASEASVLDRKILKTRNKDRVKKIRKGLVKKARTK